MAIGEDKAFLGIKDNAGAQALSGAMTRLLWDIKEAPKERIVH